MDELKPLLECLIFVSPLPIGLKRILEVIGDSFTPKAVEAALENLIAEYDSPERGLYLQEVAEGLQFRTKPRYSEWIKRMKKTAPTRLSKAALETLAIVAYKQPVVKGDIERLRGVEVDGILRTLLEKNLVRILGRKEIPGRPILYGTTKRFLELFELKDLSALPSLDEIKSLREDLIEEDETE
ncbi:MAG: SMC-Scp complex subunit ScpB [Deltaproteobacteria bacterium]|nr:SMC-Scp complex subunit ScpB [Deltaproteobacteria bacterium]